MARYIMVQGTMSNAGKSFVAAALCRIFHQDGYRVAPFKSQNMALNSFVTEEGLEMGRAQVVQAEAAGIKPSVAMNPILLKPTGHMGSQVIVNGEVLGNYSAAEYYKMKKSLVPHIKAALKKLEAQYDVIVIEGAGSPAEINLKEFDIVNMGMAKMVEAPVLLVGDIDRGGVFASLYGTVKLLEEDEQQMIKGILINKFRGDVKLLEPGLDMIEEKTGIPVLGVIPMEHIDIEEEDSLAERLSHKNRGMGVDIAIVHFPHISNFTDFAMLERLDGVSVRYVERPEEVAGEQKPDCLILPGTKNTMADLKWMNRTGLKDVVRRLSEKNVPVVGICGGFQMLGERLTDRYGVEEQGTMDGLGLLQAETEFSREKVRTQIKAKISETIGKKIPGWQPFSGLETEGYEIHMGVTKNLGSCLEFLTAEAEFDKDLGNVGAMGDSGKAGEAGEVGEAGKGGEAGEDRKGGKNSLPGSHPIGLCRTDGLVWGTYLHGFFDAPGVAKGFISWLKEGKDRKETEKDGTSVSASESFSWKEYKEQEYDKLADLVRRSVDMEQIYEILNSCE